MKHPVTRSSITSPARRRARRAVAMSACGLAVVLVATACTSTNSGASSSSISSSAPAPAGIVTTAAHSASTSAAAVVPGAAVGPVGLPTVGQLPAAAQAIMSKPAYQAARWNYLVRDVASKQVLLSYRADQMAFTGSLAKQFTIGSAYASLGENSTISTPVYTTTAPVNGVVNGNLVLVAAGDPAMGGRGAMDGRIDQAFTATTIDHIYGDLGDNAAFVKDDPLAGLDSLAKQIAAKGIKKVSGDVTIDTRLWQTFAGQEGPVPSIFVNDNILDLTVSGAAAAGSPATISLHPQTQAFAVQSKVRTVAKGGETALHVALLAADPHTVVVSGTIVAGASQLTIYRIQDAASWARTLFIEALKRAGVSVGASATSANTEAGLPARNAYPATGKLASITSPALHEFGSMILTTSWNTGANAMMCLMAAADGSTTCLDGLKTIRKQIVKAGLDSNDVVLVDGQGADPASTNSTQMVNWLAWAQTQPWGKDLEAGQPVLGVSGTLASSGLHSPANGFIHAKTGTSAAMDPATGRVLYNVQSMSGYMTTKSGRQVQFSLSMGGATYPDLPTALAQAADDVGDVVAAMQQAL